MQTVNEVKLRGRLARDAESKVFNNGGTFTKISICTEHHWKDRNGEWHKDAEFHSVVLRGKHAPEAATLRKNDRIEVVGRLKTRSWESNGRKQYVTEVVTWDFARVTGDENE